MKQWFWYIAAGSIVTVELTVISSVLACIFALFGSLGRLSKKMTFKQVWDGYQSHEYMFRRVIDPETGERRASTKANVDDSARFVDALPQVSFYWGPLVTAEDVPLESRPLHELEAVFANTGKYFQAVDVVGERMTRRAVENPQHERTKSFLRHILPKEGDSAERVASGAPVSMGNDAPPQGDVGAALCRKAALRTRPSPRSRSRTG